MDRSKLLDRPCSNIQALQKSLNWAADDLDAREGGNPCHRQKRQEKKEQGE
jgi:hypothetical protein